MPLPVPTDFLPPVPASEGYFQTVPMHTTHLVVKAQR